MAGPSAQAPGHDDHHHEHTIPNSSDQRDLAVSTGVIDCYFADGMGQQLVKHQIGSFDDFVSRKLDQIIDGFNSIDIYNTYLPEFGVYKYVISVSILNPTLAKPTIIEKDGSTKVMMPNDARLRNLTYSAALSGDVTIVAKTYSTETREYAIETTHPGTVQLGRLPLMVRSKYCMLQHQVVPSTMDECRYDSGGYFIVNGNEKVLISQDRIAENRTYVFVNTKASGYSLVAEIRSVQEERFGVPKTTALRLSTKPNQFGHCVRMTMHHVRHEIPIFIVFRALGIESDRDIMRMIVHDEPDDPNANNLVKQLVEELKGCIDEASSVRTHAEALEYIARHLSYATQVYGSNTAASSSSTANGNGTTTARPVTTPKPYPSSSVSATASSNGHGVHGANKGLGGRSSAAAAVALGAAGATGVPSTPIPLPPLDRVATLRSVLLKDVLPHVGPEPKAKALYLGYMLSRLLRAHLGMDPLDDRDSFINKRLDTPGVLLATLFRQYYGKVVKDMRVLIQKELKNGSWRATQRLVHVVNKANIYKIIKPTIIETGVRYSLATGNWGVKTSRVRQGVAQLLNRMTYPATMSHLRRVNTPIEKTGKLVQPRKLHPTQWGVICPSETPEVRVSPRATKNILRCCLF
jgi:DNA-directed RNA polymerase beta subunit